MILIIAGFGGFLGRKGDDFPGPKAIWEGMEKVRHFALGIEAAKDMLEPRAREMWVIVWPWIGQFLTVATVYFIATNL